MDRIMGLAAENAVTVTVRREWSTQIEKKRISLFFPLRPRLTRTCRRHLQRHRHESW